MTVPLTGSQSLFARLGKIFHVADLANTYRGTTAPPPVDELRAEYDDTDQSTIEGIYASLLAHQNSISPFLSSLKALATSTVTRMADDDTTAPIQNSLSLSLSYIINQMVDASATVKACHASASVTPAAGNSGNASVLVGFKTPLGLPLENVFDEEIVATVTGDSQPGGRATAGREPLAFRGAYLVSDPLHWLYPVGSGATTSLQCADESVGYLNNGGFDTFANVPNVPDGWKIGTGTAGSTIAKSVSPYYDGAASLGFVGNGSEHTSIYQEFNTIAASGTTHFLTPFSQVAVNAFLALDTVGASGTVEFALVDNAGAFVSDHAGTPNVFTKDLSTLSAGWWPVGGFFRTPRVLPDVVRLRLRLSVPMTTGRTLYFDRVVMVNPSALYPGGPVVAAFSGNDDLMRGDSFLLSVFNDRAGKFQFYFDKFFGMRQLGLTLPSSDSPTISDSLIS